MSSTSAGPRVVFRGPVGPPPPGRIVDSTYMASIASTPTPSPMGMGVRSVPMSGNNKSSAFHPATPSGSSILWPRHVDSVFVIILVLSAITSMAGIRENPKSERARELALTFIISLGSILGIVLVSSLLSGVDRMMRVQQVSRADLFRGRLRRHMLVGDDSEIGLASKLRRWYDKLHLRLYWDSLLWVTSLLSCITFVYLTYEIRNQQDPIMVLEVVFSLLICLDLAGRFLFTTNRLAYAAHRDTLIDLLTVIPALRSLSTGKYFVSFTFLRFLRVSRQFRKVAVARNGGQSLASRLWMLVSSTMSVIFCTAGFLFVVENPSTRDDAQITSFLDALYFTTVTISTVGYGDIALKGDLGKLLIVILIAIIVIMVPLQTSQLVQLFSIHSVYSGRFGLSAKEHIVVLGEASIRDFLVELYHSDRINSVTKTVMMGRQRPGADTQYFLKHHEWSNVFQFLQGVGSSREDATRLRLASASACFVFARRHVESVDAEDSETVLRVFSARRQAPDVLLYVLINRPAFKHHLYAAGVDQVVCANELRMSLLAQTTICPGVTTLLSNLLHSIAIPVTSNKQERWLNEYTYGIGFEIYAFPMPKVLWNVSFARAARIIYGFIWGTLIAFQPHGASRVVLNACTATIPPHAVGFVIAQNEQDANKVSHMTQDDIADRGDGMDGPTAPFDLRSHNPHHHTNSAAMASIRSIDFHFDDIQERASNQLKRFRAHASLYQVLQQRSVGGTESLADEMEDPVTLEMLLRLRDCYSITTENKMQAQATIDSVPISQEGHVVVSGIRFSGIYHFVLALRSVEVPQRPIYLLTPQPLPEASWRRLSVFTDIFVVLGNALHYIDLVRVGVRRAHSFIILSSELKAEEEPEATLPRAPDALSILVDRSVRETAASSCLVTTELSDQASVRFLSATSTRDWHTTWKSSRSLLQETLPSSTLQVTIDESSYYMHPAYAAGLVYVSAMLDSLMAQAYFNPFLIGIVEDLITGAARDGGPYDTRIALVDLDEELLRSLGREDAARGDDNDNDGSGDDSNGDASDDVNKDEACATYRRVFSHFISQGNVPLGLYRCSRKNPTPYVFTSPQPMVKVTQRDRVYILVNAPGEMSPVLRRRRSVRLRSRSLSRSRTSSNSELDRVIASATASAATSPSLAVRMPNPSVAVPPGDFRVVPHGGSKPTGFSPLDALEHHLTRQTTIGVEVSGFESDGDDDDAADADEIVVESPIAAAANAATAAVVDGAAAGSDSDGVGNGDDDDDDDDRAVGVYPSSSAPASEAVLTQPGTGDDEA